MPLKLHAGDTIIEVSFAIAVFALVATISISMMNTAVNSAQTTLEYNMARSEMEAQAEALRFIHDSYLSERELASGSKVYYNLWHALIGTNSGNTRVNAAISPDALDDFNQNDCRTARNNALAQHPFIVNTRQIDPTNVANTVIRDTGRLNLASLYPRLIFNGDNNDLNLSAQDINLTSAEGIWIVAVRDETSFSQSTTATGSGYWQSIGFYDFHIRTCWYGPGRGRPTTISSIVRLYNPEVTEAGR